MGHKQKEIFYKCPKCKSTDEVLGLQLTGLKKKPAILRHICGSCGTHMVRHVIDLTTSRKLREALSHDVMVRGPINPNKEGTLTPSNG